MALRFLFLSMLLFTAKFSFGQSECKIPSLFWCDDDRISKDCGVVEQCKALKEAPIFRPVEFALYYESLCPDCKQIFQYQLYQAYQKVGSIMNITLVPYGNAREYYDYNRLVWTFYCQHGQQECLGNVIETCVISMYKNISDHFPFINCMETSNYAPKQALEACANQFQMDTQAIISCSMSAKGNALEHKMALKTEALLPRHQYVPWVTVNGVHTQQIQNMAMTDLTRLICMTYTGTPKPLACAQYEIPDKAMRTESHN